MMSSLIGRKLGKYEIIELLGQGGMATVYKGYQPDFDRFVAVKVLPPHPGQDHQFIERFRLEARTIAQLQHPHILPVHDYGNEGSILYLVMAFVDGGSLKERIDSGPMPLNQVEVLLRQVASALDYAHRRGVVHRDIKPDNVLLDAEGHALLGDFGIAKIVEGETGLTTTGGIVGTPAYMAPEQGQGLSITPKADIYSLGVIVYEMLTGRQPFAADTPMQVVLKHITEPVPSITQVAENVPAGLENVMRRVLAKNPEDRYDNAMEFAQEFLRTVHQGTTAIKLKPLAPADSTQRANPTPSSSAAYTPAPSLTPPPSAELVPAASQSQPMQIVQPAPQRGGSPLLILGGLAIIALLIVAVVFLLVTNDNNNTPLATPVSTAVPTEVAAVIPSVAPPATDAQQVVAPANTPVPLTNRGRASYSSTRGLGDTVNVQVQNLTAPPGGQVYALWLRNTEDDSVLPIGELQLDAGGGGIHSYTDQQGQMLPALYNALLISQETEIGDTPSAVVYEGRLPEAVPAALREIFIQAQQVAESRIPSESLFDGAQTVAQTALTHTSIDHSPHSVFWLHNRTEHTLNVLNSTQIDYDSNEVAENPGFDVGLDALLDSIAGQLDAVASAAQGDPALQQHTQRMSFCLANVRNWKEELADKEVEWTTRTDLSDDDVPGIQEEIAEATALIEQIINGVDFNGNGRIENFPGECGLQQIPEIGILMGSIEIHDAGEA